MNNEIIKKELQSLTVEETAHVVKNLIDQLLIEFKKSDRSGIYAKTQTEMAYNSNKIEGSTLTPDQTASLFHTGTLRSSGEIVYRAKDIEEMTGHFSMFNKMLQTWDLPLTEDLIKSYHYHLKAGVFEDMANGYPVGEYKNRINMVSNIETARPDQVPGYMQQFLEKYAKRKETTVQVMAWFHAAFEKIHPFQDGNGRVGRMLLFKECLSNGLIPIIIRDDDKEQYYHALNQAQTCGKYEALVNYFQQEQERYYSVIRTFLLDYSQESQMHISPMQDLEHFLASGSRNTEQVETDKRSDISREGQLLGH